MPDDNQQGMSDDGDTAGADSDGATDTIMEGDTGMGTHADTDTDIITGTGTETEVDSETEADLETRSVTGTVVITGEIVDLHLLNCLERFDGTLKILETQITDLDGLENLALSIGATIIQSNKSLLEISLKSLSSVQTMSIVDNRAVAHVALPALVAPEQESFYVGIASNDSLDSIDMSRLRSIDSIRVDANPRLSELDLSSLEAVRERFSIVGNESLQSMASLSQLANVGSLEIQMAPLTILDIWSNRYLVCDFDAILAAIKVGENADVCNNGSGDACGPTECP